MKAINIIIFLLCAGGILAGEESVAPEQRVERYLTKATVRGYSGSVLLAMNGKILLKNGYGMADTEKAFPFKADTIFDIGSITKQFTAACILKLEMEEKLSVNDPLSKFFDAAPQDKKTLTLHQLLTHTAGMVDGLGSDEEMISLDDYLKKAFAADLIHEPGKYEYSNAGYSILAAVVEKTTGEDYEKYLREKLLLPAGMKETGYVLPQWDKARMATGYRNNRRWGTTFEQSQYEKGVTWHLKGNGGIHSTVSDLYLWYQALRKNEILTEKAKQKYFTPYVQEGEGVDSSYGYGWSIRLDEQKHKTISHNGGNGYFMATMAMIPEIDFVVIASTNRNPKNKDVIAERIAQLMLTDLKELDDSFVTQYAGTYRLPSGSRFSVDFNENDRAVFHLDQSEPWVMLGGDDSDNKKTAEQFDARTSELLKAALSGNVERVSSLAGLPVAELSEMVGNFRKRLEEANGKWKDLEVLGSVSRRKGTFYLTPVRLLFERGNEYRLAVWKGETLVDLRESPEGNTKEFEPQGENRFRAESNNRTVEFGMDGAVAVLRITATGQTFIAQKIND